MIDSAVSAGRCKNCDRTNDPRWYGCGAWDDTTNDGTHDSAANATSAAITEQGARPSDLIVTLKYLSKCMSETNSCGCALRRTTPMLPDDSLRRSGVDFWQWLKTKPEHGNRIPASDHTKG